MLYTSYLARLAKLRTQFPHWQFFSITSTAHSPLAPPPDLLAEVMANRPYFDAHWEEYEKRYYQHIYHSPEALAKIEEYAQLLRQGKTICLLCYEGLTQAGEMPKCHRELAAWAVFRRAEWEVWREVPREGTAAWASFVKQDQAYHQAVLEDESNAL